MIFGYPLWAIAVICIGVFAASFVDAIGGGGGTISVPAYLIAGLPVHLALGTNKLSSFIGTSVSTARFARQGYVNLKLAIPSAVLAIVGSHLGTRLQLKVDENRLRYILVVVLVAVAALMIKKKEFPETAGDIDPRLQAVIVLASSFIIGGYDGFYGPGAGAFLLIVFCRVAKMDLRTASGNVKVVNVSSNLGALVTSIIAGKVLYPIGLIAAVFAVVGHFIGAGLMIKNGSKIVTPIILTVLGILFVRIILELFGVI